MTQPSIVEKIFKQNIITSQLIGAPDWFIEELNSFDRIVKRRVRGKLGGKDTILESCRVWHLNPYASRVIPFRGGTRMDETATEDNFKVFAMDMTTKGLLANLPMGGAKGGLPIDQSLCINNELRMWTEALAERFYYDGSFDAKVDCLGPDVGVTSEMMGWMLFKLSKLNDNRSGNLEEAMTGKPLDLGGLPGREDATSHGLLIQLKYFVEHFAKDAGIRFSGDKLTYAITGKGNVGWNLALLTKDPRFNFLNPVTVSGRDGGVYNPKGLDIDDLGKWLRNNNNSLKGYPGADAISNEEIVELNVDCLSLAGIEGQIDSNNAHKVGAKLCVEGTNEGTTPKAHKIMSDRGITSIPAPVSSTGGVVGSNEEYRLSLGDRLHPVDYSEKKKQVTKELTSVMQGIIKAVWRETQSSGQHLAQAADMLAKKRLLKLLERKHRNINKFYKEVEA